MAQIFEMKLIKQGLKEQKLGLRTGHIYHLASFMVGYLIVLSNTAVLCYMVSSFQLISLQLSKKGEHSGAGERSKAMPTPLPTIPVIPVRPRWLAEARWLPEGVVRKSPATLGPLPQGGQIPSAFR